MWWNIGNKTKNNNYDNLTYLFNSKNIGEKVFNDFDNGFGFLKR